MILHPDGRIEGTPEEVAEYMKRKDPMFGKMHVPLERTQAQTSWEKAITRVDARYPGSGTVYTSNTPSQASYETDSAKKVD